MDMFCDWYSIGPYHTILIHITKDVGVGKGGVNCIVAMAEVTV